MKTIAVFLADGFEEIEALNPVDFCRRAGLNVIMVQVPSKTTKEKYLVVSAHNVKIIADLTLEEFFEEYRGTFPDFCVLPGGLNGAKNLASEPQSNLLSTLTEYPIIPDSLLRPILNNI